MQIPILNGIYTDGVSDFRTSYPRNMVPVPKQQGVSEGYLRPAEGIVQFGEGPAADRGGINWNGVCYRAMGPNLCRIDADGTTTVLVNAPNHGALTGTYVTFSGATVFSGVVIVGQYQLTVVNANLYAITYATPVPAGNGGGSAVTFAYQPAAGVLQQLGANGMPCTLTSGRLGF